MSTRSQFLTSANSYSQGYTPVSAALDPNEKKPSLLLRLTTVLAFGGLIFVNWAANTGKFGPTNAEISAKYPTPITPAGWAFSIWGIIFSLQLLGVLYMLFPGGYDSDSHYKERIINAAGYSPTIGWAFQCAWQYFFAKEQMDVCFALLFATFLTWSHVVLKLLAVDPGSEKHFISHLGFVTAYGLNLGWMTAAASVGGMILAVWKGIQIPTSYAVATIAFLGLVGSAVLFIRSVRFNGSVKTPAYAVATAVCWALAGVYDKQTDAEVRTACMVSGAVVAALCILVRLL